MSKSVKDLPKSAFAFGDEWVKLKPLNFASGGRI
jgi:hypothetical protein